MNCYFRYLECKDFDADNVKELNMSVAMMFRYTWYGSIHPFPANTRYQSRIHGGGLMGEGGHLN